MVGPVLLQAACSLFALQALSPLHVVLAPSSVRSTELGLVELAAAPETGLLATPPPNSSTSPRSSVRVPVLPIGLVQRRGEQRR